MSVTRIICTGGCGMPIAWCACKRPFKRIVLAGGPCAGKSTALLEVPKRLPSFTFFLKPEAASTCLKETGGKFGKVLQDKIFKKELELEAEALEKARKSDNPRTVVLYDRGFLDQTVYASQEQYAALINGRNMTEQDVIDRYDHVIYMHSAARGAAEHYSNKSNTNRTENVDRAAHICRKTEKAWSVHPNVVVVDNSTDMKGKIDKVVGHIIEMMGK